MTRWVCPAKQSVLGVDISTTSYGETLRLCRRWIAGRREAIEAGAPPAAAHRIAVCNVHSVMSAVLDAGVRRTLNEPEVAVPDGMPLVWALRSLGQRAQQRVYGPDLMLALCGQAARLGHKVYLYGGREESLAELGRRLRRRFPDLEIAGAWAPPFRALTREEDRAAIERIRGSGAEIVFVGLGMPKQERWMEAHAEELDGMVLAGVGAAFDFHAGRVPQAPGWMQRAGLEWLFRLGSEPRRLWRRYLLLNPPFVALWALQKAGILQYAKRPGTPAGEE